jgi:RNase P subunit RPR2
MAVVVIEKREPKKVRKQFNCRECRSTLEASANDGRYVSDQRDGDCIAITCPVCGKENWLDTKFFK